MSIIQTDEVDTAATDGITIYFNPRFAETLTLDELVFVFCHEVLHGIFQHGSRGKYWADLKVGPNNKPYSHRVHNIAADYIINAILKLSHIGTMPKEGLIDSRFNGDEAVEDVYCRIYDEQEQPEQPNNGGDGEGDQSGSGSGANGPDDDKSGQPSNSGQSSSSSTGKHGGFDEHLVPDGEPKSEDEVRISVNQAMEVAKQMGNLPGTLAKALANLFEAKVNWKEALASAFQPDEGRESVTWAKPHRRRLAMWDIYFPSAMGFRTGPVAIIMDISGSISPNEQSQYLGELQYLMQTCKPDWVKVLWVNDRVQHVDEPDDVDQIAELSYSSSGGTDMGAGLAYIENNFDEQPETIVVLTDGYTPWGVQPEKSHVIWGITEPDITAPYGQTIYVEINNDA